MGGWELRVECLVFRVRRKELSNGLRQFMEAPCQRQGDGYREQEGGPVAEVVLCDGFHDEVHVDEIGFQ